MQRLLLLSTVLVAALVPAPPLAAAPPPGLDEVVITDVDFRPRTLRPGARVRITFGVRNRGTRAAPTQSPRPGTVYRQGQGWRARGFAPVEGRFRVGIALSGPRGQATFYRWGLGRALRPLEYRRVVGYLRLTAPGSYAFYPAMVLEGVGERRIRSVGLVRVTGRSGPYRTVAWRILVDGEPAGTDVPPKLIGATVMVPLRFIAEEMGADVAWQHRQKRVVIRRGGRTVTTTVGSNQLHHGEQSTTIYQPARIIRGRIFVPLRAVGYALGAGVEWDGRTRTVHVRTGAAPGPTGPT